MRRSPLSAIVAVVVAIGAAGIVSVLVTTRPWLDDPALLVALTLVAAANKAFPFLRIHRGEGEEVNFDEAVLVVMLVSLPPASVAAAALGSTLIAHVVRRRSVTKTVYNHASQAVAVTAAIAIHRLFSDAAPGDESTASVVAAGIGALGHSVVSSLLIAVAIAVTTGTRFRTVALMDRAFEAMTAVVSVGWGLGAVVVAADAWGALVLTLVPVVVARLLWFSERQRQLLETLLSAATSIGAAVRDARVDAAIVDAANESLRTDAAEIRSAPPAAHEVGARISVHDADRWLVVTRRHTWDPFKARDERLIEGLGSIAAIAVENARFLESVGRDPVTGLPGSSLFIERAGAALNNSGEGPALGAVIVLKVGRLDVLKQTFGPGATNAVLEQIGERLQDLTARPGVWVARGTQAGYLGDGEFVVAVHGVGNREDALRLGRRIDHVVRQPVVAEGTEITVDVTTGVATGASDRTGSRAGAAALLRDALATASRIVQSGGDRVQLADIGGGASAAARLTLESELRRALAEDALTVHFQPIVQLATGTITGAEALVRWTHPEYGDIEPATFIPIAEDAGLIVELDRRVLRSACASLSTWIQGAAGTAPTFSVSVNLSARQLAEPDVVEFVRSALTDHQLDPQRLTLEVTETSVMYDAVSVAATLSRLRHLGVQLAIDDFGTGYSSLTYLRDFAVDALKVDKSFVDGMITRPGDAAIVAATVRLAHTLGLRVVAEGVETDEQLVALRTLRCDSGQGHLWASAMPAEEFARRWLGRATRPGTATPEHLSLPDAGHGVLDEVLDYVVHELRSPLMSIDAYTGLVARSLEAEDIDLERIVSLIEQVRRGAAHIGELLDGLQDLSMLQIGGLPLERAPIDLMTLVEEVVDAMMPTLAPHPIHLDRAPPLPVLADALRVRQVVRNLISNAAKFSSPEAPIEIAAESGQGRAMIHVRDHGAGVPEDRRHELFRRFSRLEPRSGGMGIGLYVSRAIALGHGGDLVHTHADGGGSVFTLGLPALGDQTDGEPSVGGDRHVDAGTARMR